ncbi:uncharacterized protein [Montipora capricornis]|uniref:uncharacterized protein n=1 Tax=Montipora capricornis TaxID=246305 RepID=UPI0035F1F8AC
MPGGDHCAVWGCDNDRRYPEKQKVLPHVGILRFYSLKNKKDVLSWDRAINRDQFKVTTSTKATENEERKATRRKRSYSADQGPSENLPLEDESLLGENFDFEYPASLSPASTADSTDDAVSKIEVATQTEYKSPEKEKRDYFIDQATCPKNLRTRKGFDVKFLADTLGINPSQVSRIYNTWVTFLSQELSFLVPWPSRSELRKSLPKRFKNFKNVRIIIDCLELFIQKPKVPASQKMTWSSYKHWNTAKLLVGITPTGVVSFIPPLWTGSISDKEIVKQSGLLNLLEAGDAVMAF